MKYIKFGILFMMITLVGMGATACGLEKEEQNMAAFRPVDCGIQAEASYEYPFLGMRVKLPQSILDRMDTREVFLYTKEDYTETGDIAYAVMRFSSTTEEERETEVMTIDIVSWEEALERIGAIGVYRQEEIARLDELTACDIHEKLGESTDGTYEYYMSINSKGNQYLEEALEKSDILISEMHELDMSLGYSAFSADRVDGIETVGTFSMEDIFGNVYTEEMFADYDLTLVNVFTTWCSPCVEEIPELEKLRQEYREKGIKLGVAAVVLDAKTSTGLDQGAVELAQTLYERSEAEFPFLIPDDGEMNGRLIGIESIPDSFFVDKDGNVVSTPYIGANTLEQWREIVDQEFDNLEGIEE